MDSSATSKSPWDIVLSLSSSWASLCCTVTILMSLFFLAFPFFLPPLMFCSGTLLFVLGLVLQVVPVFPPHFFPFLPNVCFLFPILLSSTGPIRGCTADVHYLMWQIHVKFFKTLELVKQVSHLTKNFKPRELSHSQQRISITETRKINIICTL